MFAIVEIVVKYLTMLPVNFRLVCDRTSLAFSVITGKSNIAVTV